MILPPPPTNAWLEALHRRLKELEAIAKDKVKRHTRAVIEANRAEADYRIIQTETALLLGRAWEMEGDRAKAAVDEVHEAILRVAGVEVPVVEGEEEAS